MEAQSDLQEAPAEAQVGPLQGGLAEVLFGHQFGIIVVVIQGALALHEELGHLLTERGVCQEVFLQMGLPSESEGGVVLVSGTLMHGDTEPHLHLL